MKPGDPPNQPRIPAAAGPAGLPPLRTGLAVFSGPSGSGKSSICEALLLDPRVHLSVSATTRAPRSHEQHGVHYYFYDVAQFLARRDRDEFVEWAQVYDHYYGTPIAPLRDAATDRSSMLLLDIDVQGAAQLRQRGVEGLYIFVAPPSLEVLRERLTRRGTDSPEVIERRLRSAQEEMARQDLYDHVLVNRDLRATIAAARELLGTGTLVPPEV